MMISLMTTFQKPGSKVDYTFSKTESVCGHTRPVRSHIRHHINLTIPRGTYRIKVTIKTPTDSKNFTQLAITNLTVFYGFHLDHCSSKPNITKLAAKPSVAAYNHVVISATVTNTGKYLPRNVAVWSSRYSENYVHTMRIRQRRTAAFFRTENRIECSHACGAGDG